MPGATTKTLETEERTLLSLGRVFEYYQIEVVPADLPEQQQLVAALVESGVSQSQIQFGFLTPLVHHWCNLPDPLSEKIDPRLLEEFVLAVDPGNVLTRSKDAIESLRSSVGNLELEEGVVIRPINKEELWEWGQEARWRPWYQFPAVTPSDDWFVIDVEISRHRDENPQVATHTARIRDIVLTALLLGTSGSFKVIPFGTEVRFGMNAVGHQFSGGVGVQTFGNPPWTTLDLDAQLVGRCQRLWPQLRELMDADRHYLALPARRLVDGISRRRADDAAVDYAIGLEALLTGGIQEELGYRFALRGATVLTWNGGDKGEVFTTLRAIYRVRSRLVHGDFVSQPEVRVARENGERVLRDIWWWYFENSTSLGEANEKIDARILN